MEIYCGCSLFSIPKSRKHTSRLDLHQIGQNFEKVCFIYMDLIVPSKNMSCSETTSGRSIVTSNFGSSVMKKRLLICFYYTDMKYKMQCLHFHQEIINALCKVNYHA